MYAIMEIRRKRYLTKYNRGLILTTDDPLDFRLFNTKKAAERARALIKNRFPDEFVVVQAPKTYKVFFVDSYATVCYALKLRKNKRMTFECAKKEALRLIQKWQNGTYINNPWRSPPPSYTKSKIQAKKEKIKALKSTQCRRGYC